MANCCKTTEATVQRFGLKYLTQDIIDGKVTEKQLLNRLKMYSDMGKVSYWEQREYLGGEYAQRILGAAEHCADCVAYSRMGIKKSSEVPLPTQRCECGSQCKCSILFMSLSEAIGKGYTA